ncbi:hypothetical protein [Vibrio atypicus]|uniref:hypothetical protein n=1 Tax=Vibrio atypicus TaxID=558271 RepID=UPI003735AFE6
MLKKTAIALTSVCAFSAIADSYGESYSQDFSGYSIQGWGLVAPVPFKYEDRKITLEEKLAYTNSNKILFDVRWTQKTLRALLGSQWDDSLSLRNIRQAFNGDNSTCKAKLEVGRAHIYGPYAYDQFVAELDSDLRHCGNAINIENKSGEYNSYTINRSGNASTVRLRTFIPTIPGVRYTFDLDYGTRFSGYDKTQENLIVRLRSDSIEKAELNDVEQTNALVNEHKITLPLPKYVPNQDFYNAKIEFVADRFFTPIFIRPNDKPNSYGPLLESLNVAPSVNQDLTPEHIELCQSFFKPYSRDLKRCLTTPEPENNLLSCNVDAALQNVVYGKDYADPSIRHEFVRVNREGARPFSDQTRYIPAGMTGAENSSNFYSVGRSGMTTVRLNCPIEGKSLYVREFSANGVSFAQYPEQGKTKIHLKCLDGDDITSSWYAVADVGEVDQVVSSYTGNDQLLRTNKSLNIQFDDEFEGCRLTAIRFVDQTHKITTQDPHNFDESGLERHITSSDGFEIQALRIQ